MDLLAGGLVGVLAGLIGAVNIMIYFGTEDGYEATLPEVFRQNTLTGIAVMVVLVAGPVLGVFVARRRRAKRARFAHPKARSEEPG